MRNVFLVVFLALSSLAIAQEDTPSPDASVQPADGTPGFIFNYGSLTRPRSVTGTQYRLDGVTVPSFVTDPTLVPRTSVPLTTITTPDLLTTRPMDFSKIDLSSIQNYVPQIVCDLPTPILNTNDFTNLMGRCEELASNINMGQSFELSENIENYRRVCNCYYEEPSVQGLEFRERESERERSNRGIGRMFNSRGRLSDPRLVTANVETELRLLQDLATGPQIQASLMSSDSSQAQAFAASYAQNYLTGDPRERRVLSTAQSQLSSAFQKNNLGAAPSLQIADGSRMLQDTVPPSLPNSCVSTRDYAAFRQFPPDQRFYSELATETRFDSNRWDFEKLRNQLTRLTKDSRSVTPRTLEEIERNPETGWIVRRLDFLNRNPLIRSILSSNRTTEKGQVFQAIRQNFTMDSATAIANSERFRGVISGIMRGPTGAQIATEAKEESTRNFSQNISGISNRVLTPRVFSTSDLRRFIPSGFERAPRSTPSPSATTLGQISSATTSTSNLGNLDLGSYFRDQRLQAVSRSCPILRHPEDLDEDYVYQALARRWVDELSPDVNMDGTQNFFNFMSNVCYGRTNAAGETKNFEDFKNERCAGARAEEPICKGAGHRELLSAFLQAYPNSSQQPDAGKDFASVLRTIPIVHFDEEQARVACIVGRTSQMDDRRTTKKALEGSYVVPNNTQYGSSNLATLEKENFLRAKGITPATSTQNTVAATTTSSPQSNLAAPQNQNGQTAVTDPLPLQPLSATATITPEAARANLDRSNAEIRSVSDQIAEIGGQLREERSKPQAEQDSAAIAGFSRQLDQLNTRLDTALRENRQLQDQLAQAQAQPQRPVRPRDDDDQSTSLPATASVVRDTNGTTGALPPTPQIQGGAATTGGTLGSPSLNGGRLAPSVSASGGSSINGALLSSRRQADAQADSGNSGAITVSSSGNEYLNLLSQTAGSEITESLPPADYTQVTSGDDAILARYRDRLARMTGEYVRIAVREQGTNQQVELIYRRVGDNFQLQSRNGKAIALQPTPEAPVVRKNRLEDLENTVRAPASIGN